MTEDIAKRPNREERLRREAVHLYLLHTQGKTVREIAGIIGKTEKYVSARIKVGERFA